MSGLINRDVVVRIVNIIPHSPEWTKHSEVLDRVIAKIEGLPTAPVDALVEAARELTEAFSCTLITLTDYGRLTKEQAEMRAARLIAAEKSLRAALTALDGELK